jgi:hypothetical protein
VKVGVLISSLPAEYETVTLKGCCQLGNTCGGAWARVSRVRDFLPAPGCLQPSSFAYSSGTKPISADPTETCVYPKKDAATEPPDLDASKD